MSITPRFGQRPRVPRPVITQPQDQSVRLIALTQDQVTLVDVEDFEDLMQWNWQAHWSALNRAFYASRSQYLGRVNGKGKSKFMGMHQYLMNAPKGKVVDHINGDTLDNRRHNLRAVTFQQNIHNSLARSSNAIGYKGIHFSPTKKNYRVRLAVNGKNLHLGYYKTLGAAVEVYNAAQTKHRGEFARLVELPKD